MKKEKFKTTEVCPHCSTEQEIDSQIAGNCPNCGNILVACTVCAIYNSDNETKNGEGCPNCTKGSNFVYGILETYEIEVCRIGYGHKTIEVEATSQEEAEQIALDEAGSYEFSEKDAEYVLPDSNNEISKEKLAAIANKLATVRDWCEIPEETESGINSVLDMLNEIID